MGKGRGNEARKSRGEDAEISREWCLVFENGEQDAQQLSRDDHQGSTVRMAGLLQPVIVCTEARIMNTRSPSGLEQLFAEIAVASLRELPAPLPPSALLKGDIESHEGDPLLGIAAAPAQRLTQDAPQERRNARNGAGQCTAPFLLLILHDELLDLLLQLLLVQGECFHAVQQVALRCALLDLHQCLKLRVGLQGMPLGVELPLERAEKTKLVADLDVGLGKREACGKALVRDPHLGEGGRIGLVRLLLAHRGGDVALGLERVHDPDVVPLLHEEEGGEDVVAAGGFHDQGAGAEPQCAMESGDAVWTVGNGTMFFTIREAQRDGEGVLRHVDADAPRESVLHAGTGGKK